METELDKSIQEIVHSNFLDTHTTSVGIVQAFDEEKQTVDVQLVLKRRYHDSLEAIPVLKEVPIQWPRAGGYLITFPIKPGDECRVDFVERSIDNWVLNGGVVDPDNTRRHDLSDAIAYVGIWNRTNLVEKYNTKEPEFRTEDGQIKFWMSDTGWAETVNLTLDTRFVLKDNGDVRAANDANGTSMEIFEDTKYKFSNPVSKIRGKPDGEILMKNPLIDRKMGATGNIKDKTVMALQQIKRDGERKFKNLILKETLGKTGNLKVKSLLSKFEMLPTGQAKLGTALNKLDINPLQSSLGGAAASIKALPTIGKALINDSVGTITPALVLNLVGIVGQIAANLGLEALMGNVTAQLREIEDLIENVIQPDVDETDQLDKLKDLVTDVLVEKGIDVTEQEVRNLINRSDNFTDSWENDDFDQYIDDVVNFIEDRGDG